MIEGSCNAVSWPPLSREEERIMAQSYKVVIQCDTQGGYVATFPELVGCRAQAGSLKTLMERIREATALWPEVAEPAAAPQKLPGTARDGPGEN
jgi:predicted RNase H-like HicB family nuclease